MEKLIIAKHANYGVTGAGAAVTIDTIDSLADGCIALFTQDGDLIASGGTPSGLTEIQVFEGNANCGVIRMGSIYPRKLTYAINAGELITAKKMVFGSNVGNGTTYKLNFPATLTVGSTVGITVVNLEMPHENTKRVQNVEVSVVEDDTVTTVLTRLIAAIAAKADRHISTLLPIVNGTDIVGLQVVGFAGINFNVIGTGLLSNADCLAYKEVVVAKTTGVTRGWLSTLTTGLAPFSPGVNTLQKLKELEAETNVGIGQTNIPAFRNVEHFTLPSRLDDTSIFTTVTVNCATPSNIPGIITPDTTLYKYTFAFTEEGGAYDVVLAALASLSAIQI